jgi:hypothetical protein
MTPEQKLLKVFELTELVNHLFREGLRDRFPNLSPKDFEKLFCERLEKCHNRNW